MRITAQGPRLFLRFEQANGTRPTRRPPDSGLSALES